MIKIMFDMDGVLCDFIGWVEYHHAYKENGKIDWKKLENIGSIFWSRMPWLMDGHKFYNLVLDYIKDKDNIELGVSSAIFCNGGKIGKKYWIEQNCPEIPSENIKIARLGIDKFKSGSENEILIDDNLKNVEEYRKVGPAIHYQNAEQAFNELKALLDYDR